MEEQVSVTPLQPASTESIRSTVRAELGLLKLESELKSQNRSAWTNLSTIASIVSLLLWAAVMLESLGYIDMIPVPPKPSGNATIPVSVADVIGVLVPALLTVVAFYVGATGLKRLQLYDNEFRDIRTERREDAEKFQAEVENRFKEITGRVEQNTEAFLDRKISEKAREISITIRQLETEGSRIGAELNEIDKKYSWIFKSTNRDILETGSISSVGELHKAITDLFRKGKIKEAKAIVEASFPNGGETHLRGSSQDFFNTATQLASSDLEPLAYRVLKEGLRFFPNNPNLLATGLKHASDAGDQDGADELYKKARALSDEQKNWRLRVFIGSYLQENKSESEVIEYYKLYIRRFFDDDFNENPIWPNDTPDERMFAQFSEYLSSFDRQREAERVALVATTYISRTPQSAGRLSTIYLENGEYRKAIEYAEKALRDDRRDQKHINASAMLMNIALSKDALLLESTQDGRDQLLDRLREVCIAYGAVLRANDIIAAYLHTIPSQMNSLIAHLEARGLERTLLLDAMPSELISILRIHSENLSPEKESENSTPTPMAFQQYLARIKYISELGGGDEDLRDLANLLRENGHADVTRDLFLQFSERFRDDPDEASFSKALNRIAELL